MITILKERFRSFEEGRSVVTAEIAVDVRTDLPAADGIEGRILSQGSIAWEISTGTLYGFNSSGEWIDQSTGEVCAPAEEA